MDLGIGENINFPFNRAGARILDHNNLRKCWADGWSLSGRSNGVALSMKSADFHRVILITAWRCTWRKQTTIPVGWYA